METITADGMSRKMMQRIGWMLTSLVILVLALDCAIKFLDLEPAKAALKLIGFPPYPDRASGLTAFACLTLCALPRTAKRSTNRGRP